MILVVHWLGKLLVHLRVLARPVGRDTTGGHARVKAGAHAQGLCFGWSNGAVDDRDGRDRPRRTPEHCGKH